MKFAQLCGEILKCNEKWIGTRIEIENVLHLPAEHIEVEEAVFFFFFNFLLIYVMSQHLR